ncbi:MEMBRANE LIPOPROTEIN-RELATED [Salix koriyanagi]|uniref:MEMBRANE LIPOPROTEIN-RELATED n=1 Tax=Salix koriyanagi TaxID=2511006 RepID=A0A9Q0W399_9ROSI|nr:MEMBRANE LIPOPROTEIN-RELATED [Salix koriyanagi]
MLEFHSFYPFLSFFSSHNSPQNASDFNGLCTTCRLLHFSSPLPLASTPAHSISALITHVSLLLASLVGQESTEGLEAGREATAKKRSRRTAKVQEESMANVAKIVEIKGKEFDDKMKSKYGHTQWVKTDFEG